MKYLHKIDSSPCYRKWAYALVLPVLLGWTAPSHAQQGGQGNTTIFGGAQMSFFSNYNFTTGGGGAQPGVILTERASNNFGILNFIGSNLAATGASDQGYVDGYVRKYGTGQFVFPVGDNGNLGQFAASGDGTMGAYYHANASTAVTSNLFTGSDYPVLPLGGPFPTTSMGAGVDAVSTVEYWDIDGATATPISLTWDAASGIAGLTGNDLANLTIVGWDGTQWVAIPSAVDATSVLGGASDLNAGSITTSVAIAPNTYTAYTFGSAEEIVVQPAFTCSPASYIITNRNIGGNNVSDIFTLDLSSGTATLAKAPLIDGPNAFVNAVGYNTVDNYIWGFRYNTNELVRIGSDWSVQTFPVTGFPSPVPGFATGDVGPDGILYLYAAGSSSITKVDLNP
ncbi:DUF6923 family protein, partial [Dyadobacter alkalitolerans]|uniref:DUF6923 family protein n=1 Tax=Dyadobacter alkalitolerans TaxID=492736 RepID=UPI00055216A1